MSISRCTLLTVFAVVTSLTAPLACHASASCMAKRYYAYISKSGNSAVLFDTKFEAYKWVDKNSSLREMIKSQSDIGAQYANCDKSEYYCISGRFDILIPKKITSLTWNNGDVMCSSAPVEGDKKIKVICMTDDGIVTKFMYSKVSGILSFQTIIPLADKYVLMGVCGLFSGR